MYLFLNLQFFTERLLYRPLKVWKSRPRLALRQSLRKYAVLNPSLSNSSLVSPSLSICLQCHLSYFSFPAPPLLTSHLPFKCCLDLHKLYLQPPLLLPGIWSFVGVMFVPQPQCLLMRESGRTASEIRFEGSWLDHLLNPEVVLDPYVCLFWILSYFDLSQQGLVLAEQSEKLMSCYYQGLAAMSLQDAPPWCFTVCHCSSPLSAFHCGWVQQEVIVHLDTAVWPIYPWMLKAVFFFLWFMTPFLNRNTSWTW